MPSALCRTRYLVPGGSPLTPHARLTVLEEIDVVERPTAGSARVTVEPKDANAEQPLPHADANRKYVVFGDRPKTVAVLATVDDEAAIKVGGLAALVDT